jgi:hypothetical protein
MSIARPSFRFSLAGLMGLVIACGVVFAALSSNSPLWSDVVMTLVLGALFTAILGACYRRRRDRAFWCGFLLFGWSYMLLAFGPWFQSEVKPHLVTTSLLTFLHGRITPIPAGAFAHYDNVYIANATTGIWNIVKPVNSEVFQRTGHCIAGFLAALIGAALARFFYSSQVPRTDQRQQRARSTSSPSGSRGFHPDEGPQRDRDG